MPFSADGGNGGVFIGVFAVDSADLDGLSSPRELYAKYKSTKTVVVSNVNSKAPAGASGGRTVCT